MKYVSVFISYILHLIKQEHVLSCLFLKIYFSWLFCASEKYHWSKQVVKLQNTCIHEFVTLLWTLQKLVIKDVYGNYMIHSKIFWLKCNTTYWLKDLRSGFAFHKLPIQSAPQFPVFNILCVSVCTKSTSGS